MPSGADTQTDRHTHTYADMQTKTISKAGTHSQRPHAPDLKTLVKSIWLGIQLRKLNY